MSGSVLQRISRPVINLKRISFALTRALDSRLCHHSQSLGVVQSQEVPDTSPVIVTTPCSSSASVPAMGHHRHFPKENAQGLSLTFLPETYSTSPLISTSYCELPLRRGSSRFFCSQPKRRSPKTFVTVESPVYYVAIPVSPSEHDEGVNVLNSSPSLPLATPITKQSTDRMFRDLARPLSFQHKFNRSDWKREIMPKNANSPMCNYILDNIRKQLLFVVIDYHQVSNQTLSVSQ
jgi:hypothetical protein